MTAGDTHDAIAAGLDGLARLTPDPHRAARVRARCRTRLERRRLRLETEATGRAFRLLPPLVVGSFCVLYVVVLVAMTLRFEGILR